MTDSAPTDLAPTDLAPTDLAPARSAKPLKSRPDGAGRARSAGADGDTDTKTETDTHTGAEVVTVQVPIGARVLIASDLHLGAVPSASSEATTIELARRLDAMTGPAVLVLAGDTFEIWAEPNNTPAKALRAHPRFTEAIQTFAEGPERQVVVLAGNHDGALGWRHDLRAEVERDLRALVALAVDLDVTTGSGQELVRIEHGHQLDRYNAFTNPAVAGDRPLGHHVTSLLVPALVASGGGQDWIADLAALNDPGHFPAYIASRLFYRRLAHRLWWVTVPGLVLAVLWTLTVVVAPLRPESARLRMRAAGLGWPLSLVAVGLVVDIGLVLLGLLAAARRSVSALESLRVENIDGDGDPNAAARKRAVDLASAGYRGLITGHTHRAEVVDLDGAFYANGGCNSALVQPVPTWSGLPTVYEAVQQNGWLELGAGPQLSVDLWYSQAAKGPVSILERWAVRRPRRTAPPKPAKVASLEPHRRWPMTGGVDRHRRDRRLASAAVAVVGVLDIVSSLTPPLHGRASGLYDAVPRLLPATASLATAASGLGLLSLAGGLRRGQRRAWLVAVTILVLSTFSNLGKGLDVEEAVVALAVGVFLLSRRTSFRSVADPGASRRALWVLTAMATSTVAAALVVATLADLPVGDLVTNFAGRMVGLRPAPLSHRWQPVSAALSGMGLSTVAYAAWLLFRPHRSPAKGDPAAEERAWQLVRRYGRGTLDYFALRDDKARFISGNTVVAFCVRHGVALVSPDPIGPSDERSRAWRAFCDHASSRGWSTAVLGASEEWLPIYHEAGMRSIYAGDEAVVDVSRFSLEGGRNKHLRQAVNRVERAGFTVTVRRSGEVDLETAAELRGLLGQSRKGDVERGYSMTLSRLFDPRDNDLLVAVARDADGRAAAFCQFVPAPGIGGYSLDLMRRADHELPNGLTDFVVIKTIEHLKAEGQQGLALNFATMRAVLAGDVADSWLIRRQRWLLRRMGDSMQIESLWRFNAKYDPVWTPRYLVVDGADRLVTTALAVASAESLWELPVLGRFLHPRRRRNGEDEVVVPAALPAKDPPSADKAPGDKAPGDKAPGDKASGDKASGDKAPGGRRRPGSKAPKPPERASEPADVDLPAVTAGPIG